MGLRNCDKVHYCRPLLRLAILSPLKLRHSKSSSTFLSENFEPLSGPAALFTQLLQPVTHQPTASSQSASTTISATCCLRVSTGCGPSICSICTQQQHPSHWGFSHHALILHGCQRWARFSQTNSIGWAFLLWAHTCSEASGHTDMWVEATSRRGEEKALFQQVVREVQWPLGWQPLEGKGQGA